jgi:hypothetical protein
VNWQVELKIVRNRRLLSSSLLAAQMRVWGDAGAVVAEAASF